MRARKRAIFRISRTRGKTPGLGIPERGTEMGQKLMIIGSSALEEGGKPASGWVKDDTHMVVSKGGGGKR